MQRNDRSYKNLKQKQNRIHENLLVYIALNLGV